VKGSNETYANENGILTIVEFSDYECPYCRSVVPTLRKLKANYNDKIIIVFKNFPVHGTILKAEAAECARDQDRFWEMHDLLFADQSEITTDTLLDYAGKIGIDKKQFEECLSSGKKKDVIKKDMTEGQRKGVSGTPTFFIGQKMIPGAMPYDTFAGIIDEELKKLEASGSGEGDG